MIKIGHRYGIPDTSYGTIGLILGIAGAIGWGTQFLFNWFGITELDKALYSLMIVVILLLACSCTFVGNRIVSSKKDLKREPGKVVIRITFIGVLGIILFIAVANSFCMSMDDNYASHANRELGIMTGMRQLTAVTAEDVNGLENWALGVRQIVRSMFLIVPCLIGTWGGLSVLTADSIDEAEGGILAIVAAFVVFLVVWIFKAIDVSLMKMMGINEVMSLSMVFLSLTIIIIDFNYLAIITIVLVV